MGHQRQASKNRAPYEEGATEGDEIFYAIGHGHLITRQIISHRFHRSIGYPCKVGDERWCLENVASCSCLPECDSSTHAAGHAALIAQP